MNVRLSRRQLLSVAGLAVGTAWLEAGPLSSVASAAPATGQVTLEPVPDQPVAVLSRAGVAPAAVPRQLAVRVLNEGVDLPVGTQLKVSFDPKLYSVLDRPVLSVGGRPMAATGSTVADPATGQAVCTLTLGEALPARTATAAECVAVIGSANQHRYPRDLLLGSAAPAAATAEVGATTRTHPARCSLKANRPKSFGGAATPWGVEVTGGWERMYWGPDNRYWYYYPIMASVTGTGPARSPDAEFTVIVDPQVIVDVTVASARLNDKPYPASRITRAYRTSTATSRQARWRTKARLGEGDQLDVRLTVTTRVPGGALPTITNPVVTTGTGAATAARQTGRLSVSRTDSSWE
jgi:hypothetical protein